MLTRRDDGSVLPLLLVYALVAAAMVVVAIDTTTAFLARRSLAALADGAALAAAQSVDDPRFYAGGNADLPLSVAAVRGAVGDYLAAAEADPSVQWDVVTDGTTVTVSLRRQVALPFVRLLGVVGAEYADGRVPVAAAAHARAPYR